MKAIPTLLILVSFSLQLLGSSPPFEFGSMAVSEMDIEYYREKYPGEPAIVIGDVADCRFVWDDFTGFFFNMSRNFRIIILTEEGLDYGNFSIPFYRSPDSQEEIGRFRAFIYNIDENKINRTRVRQRDGLTQKRGNNWHELIFAFPKVNVGSVIEVQYDIMSNSFQNLRSWYFQREIPVLHSEYNLNLPTFMNYSASYVGGFSLDIAEQYDSAEEWIITRKVKTIMGNVDSGRRKLKTTSTQFRWAAKDVLPIVPEPLIDNLRNYQARIVFDLIMSELPNDTSKDYAASWESVIGFLDKYKFFGKYLKESSSALWPLMPSKTFSSPEEIIWYAIETIHENVKWNDDASFLTERAPGEVLSAGVGNSAEVNLLLVALLRNLGMETYPVVLSTVENGSIFINSPSLTRWNYVIALIRLPEGGEVLLDATVQKPIPGYLPYRAINGRGRTIDPAYNKWINLETNINHLEQSTYNLKLDDDGTIKGNFIIEVGEFGKYNYIQRIISMGEEELWNYRFSDIAIHLTNKTINYDIKDGRPLIMKAEISIPNYAQKIGDEMIIPARLFEAIDENIFMSEERLYPVFFKNTLNLVTILNFELPENMILSFRPEEKTGRWRSFTYGLSVNETDKGFQVIWKNIRRNRIVQPPQYSGLKTYYSKLINDNLEKIIVKVNTTNKVDAYQNNE